MKTITINGTDYDVYEDVDGATTYLAGEFGLIDTWDGASSEAQERALVWATRTLDALAWRGEITDPAQEHAWPRKGITDQEERTLASDEIPAVIRAGAALLAAETIADEARADDPASASNVKSVGAGPAKVEFFRPQAGTPLPSRSHRLLRFLLAGRVAPGASYGNDGENELESGTWDKTTGVA